LWYAIFKEDRMPVFEACIIGKTINGRTTYWEDIIVIARDDRDAADKACDLVIKEHGITMNDINEDKIYIRGPVA